MGEEGEAKAKTLTVDEQRAAAGLALFGGEEEEAKLDVEGAQKFKDEHDAKIKAMEEEINGLTGKDNKKARTEKSKELSNFKVVPQYIDACKVVKGLQPKNGFFAEAPKAKPKEEKKAEAPPAEAPPAEEKKEEKEKKPAKKVESAGISKAERDELEKLKNDIIKLKKELKEQGKSGGECNKDPQVVAWVARMQELKIKEDPTLANEPKKDDKKKKGKGALSTEEQAELEKLKGELEVYRGKLLGEFGYSKKEAAADPDFKEMEAKVKEMEKRA